LTEIRDVAFSVRVSVMVLPVSVSSLRRTVSSLGRKGRMSVIIG